jgi:thioredoxin 2
MANTQVIRCPKCGAKNRVPRERIDHGQVPVCGRCKTRLPVSAAGNGAPITVTDSNFPNEVERSEVPVLLDLWAPWCGPCRMMGPVVEELASQLAGRVRVGKLNIDENPATAARFGVSSIPTLLVLKSGREVDRIVGLQPKEKIAQRLERLIA